ncbi:hypothetical protein MRBLMR1_004898 [Neorhizobium sp. LMR1-1-1.1]
MSTNLTNQFDSAAQTKNAAGFVRDFFGTLCAGTGDLSAFCSVFANTGKTANSNNIK